MKKHVVKVFAVVAAVMFLSITVLEFNAHARVGGGRSFGSRGTRSYSQASQPHLPSRAHHGSRLRLRPKPPSQQQPAAVS